jgi:hypothetical protein
MSRASRFMIASLLALATLGACQDRKQPTAPAAAAMSPRAGENMSAVTDPAQLAELRKVTARFHTLEAARQAGYAAQITPCWAHHSAGAMGYHYGNTALFDATADLLQPELLIYEPQAGDHMRLVGMEYLVPLAAWQAAGHDLNDPSDVPELLGQKFTRHSFLPIFKLHIWLWQNNPSGMFADWNPSVSCQYADSTEVF